MPICSNYGAVYGRHEGPFVLVVCRQGKATKRNPSGLTSERLSGKPMSAEDTHETARALIEDPRDPILKAYAMSETGGGFIGAYYERGQPVPAWYELQREAAAF